MAWEPLNLRELHVGASLMTVLGDGARFARQVLAERGRRRRPRHAAPGGTWPRGRRQRRGAACVGMSVAARASGPALERRQRQHCSVGAPGSARCLARGPEGRQTACAASRDGFLGDVTPERRNGGPGASGRRKAGRGRPSGPPGGMPGGPVADVAIAARTRSVIRCSLRGAGARREGGEFVRDAVVLAFAPEPRNAGASYAGRAGARGRSAMPQGRRSKLRPCSGRLCTPWAGSWTSWPSGGAASARTARGPKPSLRRGRCPPVPVGGRGRYLGRPRRSRLQERFHAKPHPSRLARGGSGADGAGGALEGAAS